MTVSLRVVLQGVTRRFGSAWVLRGVDAVFEAGSITVVEGANGAGKSTLLGIVAGLVQPTGGVARWEPDGEYGGDRRNAIGWVGHDSCCYRDLTAVENVQLAARTCGAPDDAAERELERVGAKALLSRKVGALSRGQKQRVALARGVVSAPALLLLDEPFSGLDASGCALFEAVIREECARGAIILVVTHDRDLSSRLEARSVTIDRGRLRSTA